MINLTYRGVNYVSAKSGVLQTLGWRRFLTYRGAKYATPEPFATRRETMVLTYRGVQYLSHA